MRILPSVRIVLAKKKYNQFKSENKLLKLLKIYEGNVPYTTKT